ncbi:hypothetical protein GQR58_024055 [Nymphon striatum]|nr:hypothetical protein GQR58_024055 [Nymphon striatum]
MAAKRKFLSLDEKLKAINLLEKGSPAYKVAEEFGVGKTQIQILPAALTDSVSVPRHKEAFTTDLSSRGVETPQNQPTGKARALVSAAGTLITGKMQPASSFGLSWGFANLASEYARPRTRPEKTNGNRKDKEEEAAGADMDVAEQWRKDVMEDILKSFPPNFLYNADETGI